MKESEKNLNLNSAKPNLFIKYLQSLSEGVKSTPSDQSGLQLVHHCLPLPPTGSVWEQRSQKLEKSLGPVKKKCNNFAKQKLASNNLQQA